MSINLRIYADQIYGFTQSYMKEYLSPEIIKEDFINKFKSGNLNYESISTKKVIKLNPQIYLSEFNIENLEINIPNETENLSLSFCKLKVLLDLNEMNDDEIENIILMERKSLIEGFMNFVIKKIEKKEESKSFIEGLIETFVNRAINGLKIDLNNLEINIRYKKHLICFDIEKISYSEENGIQMNNFSISLIEDENKKDILKKFSLNIELKTKKDNIENKEENKKENDENNIEDNKKEEIVNDNRNRLNISITNIEFDINQNVIYALNDIFDLFNTTQYKKIFLRYKKLIQFHKPQKSEDKNVHYISLWYYAIKTVLKLQKYIGHKKDYIFDLIENTQEKLVKKYLNDNKDINNLLLPNEIILLKSTKEKVEKQLLENKKGSGITKAFSFFFGGGGDDDKKELTEEEKKELNDIYTNDFIIKYLLDINTRSKSGSNPFSDKINKIISDLLINIQIDKIEVKENNYNCNFFIKSIKINFNLIDKKYDFEININDIGTLLNESLFSDKLENINYLMQVKKELTSNMIKLNFGFNNIVLNEDMFIFLLTYFSSFKNNSNFIRLFHNIDYNQFINKEEKENNDVINNEENKENNDNYIQILDNFCISHIPSLSFSNSDKNKIDINIQNFILDKNMISFSLDIKDSFGIILDNYHFNFNILKEGNINKYKFYLEQPMNITISKDTSFLIFLTYLKLNRIAKNKSKNKNINNPNKNNSSEKNEINYLFCFNYVEHKEVNIDFNNYFFDCLINELNIELNEKNCSTNFYIKKMNLKYENKNLLLNTEKIEVNTDYSSDIILYLLDFKSKDFEQYEKIISENLNDNNKIVDIQNNNKIDLQNNPNNITTNYNIKMSDVISNLNLEIGIIIFGIKIEENIIYANIINTKGQNNSSELNTINITTNNINVYIEQTNNSNAKYNILDIAKPLLLDYNLTTELIKVKLDSPILNIFIPIFSSILNNLEYLSNQIDWTVIICKMQSEIFNASCKVYVFNININYLYISNFDGKSTDTFFLVIKDFLLKNEKNVNILEEKELSLNYTMKSKKEDFLGFKLKELKSNISQHDIGSLTSLMESNKNENGDGVNNNLIIDEKNNAQEEKEYCLLVEGEISDINFGLCLDDYTKKSNFIFNKINLNIRKGKINNEEKNILENLLEYKIVFNRINFKYYDEFNKEIIVLNYKKDIKKSINISEKFDQIKIISKDKKISLNLNNNYINVRFDYFLYLYYFFNSAFPSSQKVEKKENDQNFFDYLMKIKNENLNIQINLNKTQFKIQTSFDAKENLFLDLSNFKASLDSNQVFNISLNSISSSIISTKQSRKLFYTTDNPISFKCSFDENKILDIDSNLGTLIINISYKDIISFLKCYLLNKILIEKINSKYKKESLQQDLKKKNTLLNSVATIIDKQKNSFIKLKLSLNNIIFTLVDNSSGNYLPFINGSLSNIELNYNQKNSIEFSYELLLNSYNYIAVKWEPIIENTPIKVKYDFLFDDINSHNSMSIDILNDFNINLSDMAISSILIILKNWSSKFIEDKNNYSNQKIKSDMSNDNNGIKIIGEYNKDNEILNKISNASVVNCSGIDFNIKYNGKSYELLGDVKSDSKSDYKLDLEYVIDWDIKKLGSKKIDIIINNNNEKPFKIPFEEIGMYEYQLNSKYYLIAENIFNKDRHINITIYSPIIIKNKTLDIFQIKFMNKDKGISYKLLKSNQKLGINYSYYNDNTLFSLNLMEKGQVNSNTQFHLKDLMNNDEFSQSIILCGKTYFIKLIRKTEKLKEILITFQYCIANCLPCELILENPRDNKKVNIKKFAQYSVDFYSDINTELIFKIKIDNEYFSSTKNKFFKNQLNQVNKDNYNKSYITFTNSNNTKSFKLALQYNMTKNTSLLIIYSESFLYNYSGVDFQILSQNEGIPFSFNIDNKLFLNSSKLDNIKNSWIQLKNNKFISNRISLNDIHEANPNYKLKLMNKNNILNLTIKKEMSFIYIRNNPNFKENIMTMIYKIYPFCRITNLLTSKKILISEENNKNNYIIINTFKEIPFNFFEKGKNISLLIGLLNKNNQCSPLINFKLTSFGIFTFCIEDTNFNIEIKESNISGVYDIFFVESNLENAKIVVENLSNTNFVITQEGYEFRQLLLQKEKQILKIYGQNCNYFILKNSQNDDSYRFSFNSCLEEQNKFEFKDLIFLKESNGMKMKLTILNKDNFNKITNNKLIFGVKLKIEKIFISLIGDNEFKDKKLRNYKRYELLLMQLNNPIIDFHLEHYSGLLDNDKINLKFILKNFNIYNQVSKYGKYSNVFKNLSEPMIYIDTQLIDYKNRSSMSKINKFQFNMSKLKLGIDPYFIEEIINFAENIFYRMEIINFNVDEIFLHKNNDYKINKQLEYYLKENSIYYGTNLSFPTMDINFDLNEIGLDDLLIKKLNYPNYLVWLCHGLVGREQNIYLSPIKLNTYSGSLSNLFNKVMHMYNDSVDSEINKIGIKGFLGQIEQFFTSSNKTDKKCIDVQKKRIRYPRAFYDKFKYYKKYGEIDAINFEKLEKKFKLEKNPIYLTDIIDDKIYLYTFTNKYLVVLLKENNDIRSINKNVDYSFVEKAEIVDNNKVKIYFNEKGLKENKNFDHITLSCENEFNAEKIKALLEEKSKNILE